MMVTCEGSNVLCLGWEEWRGVEGGGWGEGGEWMDVCGGGEKGWLGRGMGRAWRWGGGGGSMSGLFCVGWGEGGVVEGCWFLGWG